MQHITPELLERCPVERGFRLRGSEMYRHALRRSKELRSNGFEVNITVRTLCIWADSAAIGLLLMVLALLVQDFWVSYTGLVLFLIAIRVRWVEMRDKRAQDQRREN